MACTTQTQSLAVFSIHFSPFSHSTLPLPVFWPATDYCVGTDCERWIHPSFEFALENLQRPIWLSPPISHTAYHPFAPRIEKVRGGAHRELRLSAKQWPPPSELWRHTWMPDVKANYVFFGVDGYASENISSPPRTMKIHMASQFSGFGMKCVEARPCSVGHGGFETLNVSILLKGREISWGDSRWMKQRFVLWGAHINSLRGTLLRCILE